LFCFVLYSIILDTRHKHKHKQKQKQKQKHKQKMEIIYTRWFSATVVIVIVAFLIAAGYYPVLWFSFFFLLFILVSIFFGYGSNDLHALFYESIGLPTIPRVLNVYVISVIFYVLALYIAYKIKY